MKIGTRIQLSTMMFLEFFVWGAWYSSVGVYMAAHGMGELTHWPFTVNAIAAIVAPFFVGFIADRFFATERVLGTLHLLGALCMFLAPLVVGNSFLFILLLLAYNICYMPTLSLANALAFHAIDDQEKQFPSIRVFGTIGWIAAGLCVSFVLGYFLSAGVRPEQTPMPLYLTSAASLLLGLFSFSLPHVPPPAVGKKVSMRSIAGVDALKQLGSPSFYAFLLSSLLICIPLSVYYAYTQRYLEAARFEFIAATQTLGQASELFFMLLMPFFFRRLGVKWMLALGMFAWVARYALFALGAPEATTWMILGGIVLHGICYDFFFVTGQIYVDKKASSEIRGQAQGLIILITYGIGMLIGTQVAGRVYNGFLEGAQALTLDSWQSFWWVPASISLGVLILFIILFREKNGVKTNEIQKVQP